MRLFKSKKTKKELHENDKKEEQQAIDIPSWWKKRKENPWRKVDAQELKPGMVIQYNQKEWLIRGILQPQRSHTINVFGIDVTYNGKVEPPHQSGTTLPAGQSLLKLNPMEKISVLNYTRFQLSSPSWIAETDDETSCMLWHSVMAFVGRESTGQCRLMDLEIYDMYLLEADIMGSLGDQLQDNELVKVAFFQGVPFWIDKLDHPK